MDGPFPLGIENIAVVRHVEEMLGRTLLDLALAEKSDLPEPCLPGNETSP